LRVLPVSHVADYTHQKLRYGGPDRTIAGFGRLLQCASRVYSW
jgi:hypothetical protein